MKVLLADGSDVVLDRLARLLGELPCIRVAARARSAAQVRDGVRAHKPDVVVLDLCIAGGSGMALLRAVKACQPPPLVVVLTADASPTMCQRCLRTADACLDKAADLQALIDVLRRFGHAMGEDCGLGPCSCPDAEAPAEGAQAA